MTKLYLTTSLPPRNMMRRLDPQGDRFFGDLTLEDGELTVAFQDQSALQETSLSLNSFPPNSTLQQAGRKRSYPASQLSIQAPSCFSVRDLEPLSKVAKVSGVSTDPFALALLATKEEAKKHASKVTVVDEIPLPSGSTSTRYCMWNIDSDLKEIIDIYFRSCMEDKAHNELVKQFPKPDVPALHVLELDKWLVLIQGKQSLASLRWEQDLQVTERNFMDAAGPLCILLQHLKDPQTVPVGEAINLVLKCLRLLGHAVATVNKHRRQDIVKSTHITDITELGKHSDSMQRFLFGESKAKELNFVGELAEKVSKAIQPQNKENSSRKNSGRGNRSSNSHGQNDHSSHSAHSPCKKQGSQSFHKKKPYNNNWPFRRAPFQEKQYLEGGGPKAHSRTEVQRAVLANSQQELRTRKTEVSLSFTHSPSCLPFVCINLENIPRAGRLKHFLQNWKLLTSDQWTLNTVKGYRLELAESPRQLRLPSPHNLNPSQLALVKDEITSLFDKKDIVSVPHHRELFYSNLFLVKKKGGGQCPALNLSSLNSFVHHHHVKMEDFKDVHAKIFHSIDFLKFLLQSDNELIVPEMQKKWGSPSLFQI